MEEWYSLINDDPTDKNSNKAKQRVAENAPNIANEMARLSYDTDRYYGFGAMTHEEARQRHIDSSRLLDGVFTLDVLENLDEKGFAYTYAGIPFKPKELIGNDNIDRFVLLSQEQIDNAETEQGKQIIERIKKATGITEDTPEFIRQQKLVRKKGIVPYKPLPDSYRPLTREQREQETVDQLLNKGNIDFDHFPIELLID